MSDIKLEVGKAYRSRNGRIIHIVQGNPPVGENVPWNGIYWGNSVDGETPIIMDRYKHDGSWWSYISQFSAMGYRELSNADWDLIEVVDYSRGDIKMYPDVHLSKQYKMFVVFKDDWAVTMYKTFMLYPDRHIQVGGRYTPEPLSNFGSWMLFEEEVSDEDAIIAFQKAHNIQSEYIKQIN